MDTPDSNTLKRCTKCGELKPRDQFGKNRAQCRACIALSRQKYYQANKDRSREYQRQYNASNRDHRREYVRNLPDETREKMRAYAKAYAVENAERLREYRREHRLKNLEHKRAYDRKYREDHIEERREYLRLNAEQLRESSRRWKQTQAGKESQRISRLRYRTRSLQATSTLTNDDWQTAIDHFGGCCAVCGRPPGLWHTLAADHWIPVSKGGSTTPANIVPLCHGVNGCNNSKLNRDATEWLIEKFGKRKGRAILRRVELFLESRIQTEGDR